MALRPMTRLVDGCSWSDDALAPGVSPKPVTCLHNGSANACGCDVTSVAHGENDTYGLHVFDRQATDSELDTFAAGYSTIVIYGYCSSWNDTVESRRSERSKTIHAGTAGGPL